MAKQESLPESAMLCAMRHAYRYRGYETAEKTRAALRRRHRGLSRDQAEDELARATAMYKHAEELAWENRDRPPEELQHDVESQLLRLYPSFDIGTVRSALGWAHYWRVLR